MVFCNLFIGISLNSYKRVTILILIDGFLQSLDYVNKKVMPVKVTILILIDGFLQYGSHCLVLSHTKRHNPYFNRWFSAMFLEELLLDIINSHNPYFNRWFSAICYLDYKARIEYKSQSLF